MKTLVGIESFEQMRKRKLARARKLDQREHVTAEQRITFENPVDMLACITPERLRLFEVAREKPHSVSQLASALHRGRRAVQRDIKTLHSFGLLKVSKQVNPGHGQVQIVETAAPHLDLFARV